MEELGFWELIHGTSAGCASIAAFETLRELLSGGPLLLVFSGMTVVIFKAHHAHVKHLKARRAQRAATQEAVNRGPAEDTQ